MEKFYVVVEGSLEVESHLDGQCTVAELRPLDSCRIGPDESRELRNVSSQACGVLLVMPRAKPDG